MPNFKPKTTKKIQVDFRSSITLDGKHNDILNEIHKEENEDDVNCNTVPPSDSSGSCPTASNGELLTITKRKRSSPTRLASFRSSLKSFFFRHLSCLNTQSVNLIIS